MRRQPLRPCTVCSRPSPGGVCATAGHNRGGYRPERVSIAIYNTPAWRTLRSGVLHASGYRCAYCGEPARSADHVIPTSRGGEPFAADNVVACCRTCNTSKGARTLAEWIRSGRAPKSALAFAAQRLREGLAC